MKAIVKVFACDNVKGDVFVSFRNGFDEKARAIVSIKRDPIVLNSSNASFEHGVKSFLSSISIDTLNSILDTHFKGEPSVNRHTKELSRLSSELGALSTTLNSVDTPEVAKTLKRAIKQLSTQIDKVNGNEMEARISLFKGLSDLLNREVNFDTFINTKQPSLFEIYDIKDISESTYRVYFKIEGKSKHYDFNASGDLVDGNVVNFNTNLISSAIDKFNSTKSKIQSALDETFKVYKLIEDCESKLAYYSYMLEQSDSNVRKAYCECVDTYEMRIGFLQKDLGERHENDAKLVEEELSKLKAYYDGLGSAII